MNGRAMSLAHQDWPSHGLEPVPRCPACAGDKRVVMYTSLTDRVFFCAPGSWTLYRCVSCETCYLDPRPTQDTIALAYSTYFTHHPSRRPDVQSMSQLRRIQRALANGYRNSRYGTRDQPSSRWGVIAARVLPRQRALMDSELRHLPCPSPGARVLDVGCGDGAFLEWARTAGWTGVGIDFDPSAVASAQSRGLDVRCGSIDSLRDEGASFDAITLSHVLEHVHDPANLLRQAGALLKPGGLLWIDTPNLASIGHAVFGASWLGLDPPRHLILFTPSSLRALLEDVGLTLVKTLSRYEVAGRVFAASYRIKKAQDPISETSVPAAVTIRAKLASWFARWRPDTSEFITIIATRDQ